MTADVDQDRYIVVERGAFSSGITTLLAYLFFGLLYQVVVYSARPDWSDPWVWLHIGGWWIWLLADLIGWFFVAVGWFVLAVCVAVALVWFMGWLYRNLF